MNTVALLGCGYWGKNLARVLHELGALALVCDNSPAGREQAARVAPGVAVSDVFERALDQHIQAVVLATPAETHYSLALQALGAGKDVFVEKPLALTLAEGNELVQLARRQQRVLMVGHVLEYHPGVRKLHELVCAGELGQVHFLHSHRLSLGKVRNCENVLWSFAPHDIAAVLRLVGQSPSQVSAVGGRFLQPGVADTTNLELVFASGVQAHVFVSWLYPFKEQRLVVVGSRRMACLDDVAKTLALYDRRVDWDGPDPVPIQGECRAVGFAADEPLRLECAAFLESLRTREDPLTNGASALRVLQVLQAGQRSLDQNGLPVSLASEVPA